MGCQPEEAEVLWRNMRAHSISSLPLNEQLKDQELCWEIRGPQNYVAGSVGKHRTPLLLPGPGCRLWEHYTAESRVVTQI